MKWLREPLSRPMRARLEITLGVVLTGAAMIGLSSIIRPDPAKLAAMIEVAVAPPYAERRPEPLREQPLPGPKVGTEFATAVAHGDIAAMDRLHTPGMALDRMLSVAAESGELESARWLLNREADVHEDEDSVDAPILLADGHPEIVALLLERGAKEPSLLTAAQAVADSTVGRLLSAHVRVDPVDASPLYAVISSTRSTAEKRRLIVEKLLAAGADPNRDDVESPLAAAVGACDDVTNDCMTLIKLLLKRGTRVRGSALVSAIGLDDPALRDTTFDTLLAARLERGATAVALARAWNIQPRAMKLLVAKGVDWNWHDGEEDAALPVLAVVQRGDRDGLRALLEAGAPADVHYKDGTCALGEAISGAANGANDYARIVELLVARGADVNRRLPDGRTPLFAAAETGELRVIKALLDKGARVNELVLDDTALDAAEQNSHQPAARVLHARGARRARKTAPIDTMRDLP